VGERSWELVDGLRKISAQNEVSGAGGKLGDALVESATVSDVSEERREMVGGMLKIFAVR
jgi:hypothetical protein